MSKIILVLLIIVIIIFIINKKLKPKHLPKAVKYHNIDDRFNEEKREREKEIDRLLDKIGDNGLGDLSTKEKIRLDELSKKIRTKN